MRNPEIQETHSDWNCENERGDAEKLQNWRRRERERDWMALYGFRFSGVDFCDGRKALLFTFITPTSGI